MLIKYFLTRQVNFSFSFRALFYDNENSFELMLMLATDSVWTGCGLVRREDKEWLSCFDFLSNVSCICIFQYLLIGHSYCELWNLFRYWTTMGLIWVVGTKSYLSFIVCWKRRKKSDLGKSWDNLIAVTLTHLGFFMALKISQLFNLGHILIKTTTLDAPWCQTLLQFLNILECQDIFQILNP